MKPTYLVAATAAVLLTQSGSSGAQERPIFVTVSAHIDEVRDATSILTSIGECHTNDMCRGAASAISAASGYPIDRVVAVASAIASRRDGEGSNHVVQLPDGYRYCTSRFRLTSIVPRDGDRGSTLLLEARNNGLAIETWTPVLPPFQGRSWVDGVAVVTGVRADLGNTPGCHSSDERHFLVCRGSGCEGEAVDRGRRVSLGHTGAGERRD